MNRMKYRTNRPGKFSLPISLCTLLVLAGMIGADPARADVPAKAREGAALYSDSSYSEAADAFRSATIAAPEDARWRYDLGLSEAQAEDYESALNNLQATVGLAAPELANQARFNVGNIHYAMENFGEAAKSYRNTLLRDPADSDAKRNLELAMRRLAEQEPSDEKSDEESEEGDENEDKEKQQDDQESDQEKDRSDEEQDESEGDQDQQDQDPQDEEQPQPDPQSDSTLTREQAERILRALAAEEAKLRDKARNLQMLPAPAGKDW